MMAYGNKSQLATVLAYSYTYTTGFYPLYSTDKLMTNLLYRVGPKVENLILSRPHLPTSRIEKTKTSPHPLPSVEDGKQI